MARRLDLEGWRRREHFEFFRRYEQPYWNVTVPVEVGELLRWLEVNEGHSYFLANLYLCLKAANSVEELRYRIRGEEVVVLDAVHGGTTVARDDGTFGFGYLHFQEDFESFARDGAAELERVRQGDSLADRPGADEYIYLTVLPWLAFTSFQHARHPPAGESNPRIVFGRRGEGADATMPVSIEVHHALVDGLHVGRFFAEFEALLAKPGEAFGVSR